MKNRTERQSTPTEGSRLLIRGQESRAQSIPRITQREAFCLLRTSFGGARLNPSGRPTWEFVRGAKLNPRRNIPDSETESPGFYGGKLWKSLTVHPVLPELKPEWNALSVPSAEVFTLVQQDFNKNSLSPLSPADQSLLSPAGRCQNWVAFVLPAVVKSVLVKGMDEKRLRYVVLNPYLRRRHRRLQEEEETERQGPYRGNGQSQFSCRYR